MTFSKHKAFFLAVFILIYGYIYFNGPMLKKKKTIPCKS